MRADVAEKHGSIQLTVDREVVASWRGESIEASAEVAACATLLPAMAAKPNRLEIHGAVSPRLRSGLGSLQEVFYRWIEDAELLELSVEVAELAVGTDRALFFSGGVDSFHALRKHRDEVDLLVYVEGFDVSLDDRGLRSEVRSTLEAAAETAGLPLTVVATDIRTWSNPRTAWAMYHGSALATVAHLLRPRIGSVIVPSSKAYEEMEPWGSHPLTDPMWSGAVEIIHSGAESSRIEKTVAIAEDEIARQSLRVCYWNTGQAYNCGRCEKCLRTMTTLAGLGVLEHFKTFPDMLLPEVVARTPVQSPSSRRLARANIDFLEKRGSLPEVRRAWEIALKGGYRRDRTRRFVARGLKPLRAAIGRGHS